jgi:hypothetical protein
MAGCATAAAQSPVPVEIRRGGDDGLTQRFADALETGIGRSGTFTMASGVSHPPFLVLNIPSHLEWTRVGDRVRARFQVEFRRGDSSLLGSSSGDCRETQLEICAARVLNDARRIARSLRWNGDSHVTVPVSLHLPARARAARQPHLLRPPARLRNLPGLDRGRRDRRFPRARRDPLRPDPALSRLRGPLARRRPAGGDHGERELARPEICGAGEGDLRGTVTFHPPG